MEGLYLTLLASAYAPPTTRILPLYHVNRTPPPSERRPSVETLHLIIRTAHVCTTLHHVLMLSSPPHARPVVAAALHEGVLPLDMDTADLGGDMFFDLSSKVLPVECANFNASDPDQGGVYRSDCTNEEVVDTDLVITKFSLEVKGSYGECTP